MVQEPLRRNYAAQLVTEKGYEIYSGPQRILFLKHGCYDIKDDPASGRLMVEGEPFFPHIATYKRNYENMSVVIPLKSYEELINLGLVITATYEDCLIGGMHKRIKYHLIRSINAPPDIGAIPEGHRMGHDIVHHCVQLIGPNVGKAGWSQWVYYKPKQATGIRHSSDPIKNAENIKKSWAPKGLTENPILRIEIKELPLIRSPLTGDVYCLEEEDDVAHIAITGDTGSGKTFLNNSLTGQEKLKWGVAQMFLNDWQGEQLDWCLPWPRGSLMDSDVRKIGNVSMPSPNIYFYLEGNPKLENIPYEGNNAFRISMPFKDFILDYENLLRLRKEWDMPKIMSRFRSIIFDKDGNVRQEFFNCQTIEEVEDFVKDNFETIMTDVGGGKKNAAGMIEKVISVIRDMWKMNFFDKANHIPSDWTVKNTKTEELKKLHPWMAAAYCGLTSIFETKFYHQKEYFPLTIKYIVQDILEHQKGMRDAWFKNNKIRIRINVDELPTILEKGSPAYEPISDIAAAGRYNLLGLTYVTQNYTLVPQRIRQNTRYMFCFHQKEEEAKLVVKDYGLSPSREWVKKIMALQKFECYAITDKGRFVIYDKFGRRRVDKGPLFGVVWPPPLNQHTPPKKETAE